MKPRTSISFKILLLAFLNLLLLIAVFAIFARLQFRLDLSSFLLTPARDKILSVSRLIALELPETPRENWPQLLERNSATYPSSFYLFTNEGEQLAGQPVILPRELMDWVKRDHNLFYDRRSSDTPKRDQGGPGPPLLLLRSGQPSSYWVGAHIPIRTGDSRRPLRGTLVWMFPSLWTNSFFFNYKSWLAVVLAVILVSVICWLPLMRDLTHSIAQLTRATRRIADGQFDLELPAGRRDELGQLSDSIHQMAEKLSGFVHGQRRFLSDIAHELCSPISRIQVALGILEQRAQPNLRDYVGDLREEVQHMSDLVSELLTFSKSQINTAERPLEAVNLSSIVQRVLQREAPDGAAIKVNLPEELEAIAHPDYVFRSLANLVRNAVRYAGDSGPINITAVSEGEEIRINVTDQGPGLPESELEHIFKPFYRPELARQRETGGTGLGLAIVQSCIQACGGSVRCRNRSPHGLDVEIRLPVAVAPEPSRTHRQPA
jgi:two-component system sensor histidine kinase CpxA